MSNKMEVESSPSTGPGHDGKKVDVHPLAIVHMSDQYTRVVAGGSQLSKQAPVVGLLLGTCDSVDSGKSKGDISGPSSKIDHLQVFDADDVPVEISDASKLQVELHQAVFPQHSVVGWYRVSRDEEPTQEDLSTTKILRSNYQLTMQDGPGKPFVFCLLHVKSPNARQDENQNSLSDDLPISLYELHDEGDSTILLGIDGWQLNTSESERIAVERVIREQPHRQPQTRQVSKDAKKKKESKKATSSFGWNVSEKEAQAPVPSTYSPYVVQTQSIQQSLSSMKDRVDVLVDFLEKTNNGTIPPNHSLLRHIHGLLYALGPLSAQMSTMRDPFDSPKEDAILLSHLAMVAKTVSVVQSYTEKFRVVHESRPSTTNRRIG